MTALLLDSFYKIDTLQTDGNNIIAAVTFDTAHDIFKGHFPDMPIVPGVCQTQMLGEVLDKALKIELHLQCAVSIKFLSIVDPTIDPSLTMLIACVKNEDGSFNVSAQYKSEDKVFFKFKGIYAVPE